VVLSGYSGFFRNNQLVAYPLLVVLSGYSGLLRNNQLLAHGWWFSPGTPASSTNKTGRHDIAESGVKHNKSGITIIRYAQSRKI
jgi:hypothetical protein